MNQSTYGHHGNGPGASAAGQGRVFLALNFCRSWFIHWFERLVSAARHRVHWSSALAPGVPARKAAVIRLGKMFRIRVPRQGN